MTKTLTLLRHAKAVEAAISGDDYDRALATRGIEAAEAVGRATKPPRLVLCSSARRTQETFEAVSASWEPKPELRAERGLYLAGAPALLNRIQAVDDAIPDIWLIGHNPGLHELARHLAAKARFSTNFPDLAYRFPTASRAVFMSDTESWGSFAGGPLILLDFQCP